MSQTNGGTMEEKDRLFDFVETLVELPRESFVEVRFYNKDEKDFFIYILNTDSYLGICQAVTEEFKKLPKARTAIVTPKDLMEDNGEPKYYSIPVFVNPWFRE
jgi:hypothetical protein